MIYTDGTHLVAETLPELHNYAQSIGLKRHFFHGVRKGHPHYDLTNDKIKEKVLNDDKVTLICKRCIVRFFQMGFGKSNKVPIMTHKYDNGRTISWQPNAMFDFYCPHLTLGRGEVSFNIIPIDYGTVGN